MKYESDFKNFTDQLDELTKELDEESVSHIFI